MAKISELTAVVSLAGTEKIPVVQGGVTKSATAQQIAGTASAFGDITTGDILPTVDATYELGSLSYRWSGAYIATNGVVTFGDSDYTVTHSFGLLTFSGALSVAGNVASSGSIFSASATSGIGYTTGAGGTVTQSTSRTTGVSINKVAGAITLFSAAGSTTPATFSVTNSAVAATDVVVLSQKSGTDLYDLSVSAVAAGSFNITFNTKSGTTVEAPVINFAVIKAVAA